MSTPQDLVSQVIAATNTANRSLQEGQDVMLSGVAQGDAKFKAGELMRQQASQLGEQVAGQVAEASYKQTQLLQQVQGLLGLDTTQANNEIAKSIAQLNSSQQEYQSARKEYDAAITTNFMDDPIGYIVAQLNLPSLSARVNVAADSEAAAQDNISTRTQMLNQSRQTLTADTADIIREAKLKEAHAQSLAAEAQLNQAQGENAIRIASAKMQAYQIADKIQGNVVSGINTISSIQNAQETRALRQEAMQDRREVRANAAKDDELKTAERELRVENLRQALKEKKLAADTEARYNEQLATVSKSLGMKVPVTMDAIHQMTNKEEQARWYGIATTGTYGPDLRSSLETYINRGDPNAIQLGGGSSIITSARKLAQSGAGYEGIVASAYRTNPANGGKSLPGSVAKAEGFITYKQDLIDSQSAVDPKIKDLSSPHWDTYYNPYVAQFTAFNKAIDTLPQLAELKNNSVKKAIDALIASGAVKTENLTAEQQKQVLLATVQQVAQRNSSPKDIARDVAVFFNAVSAYDRTLNKYDNFSLPPQESYMFTLPSGKVDLMNPVDVERGLLKSAKIQLMQNVSSGEPTWSDFVTLKNAEQKVKGVK